MKLADLKRRIGRLERLANGMAKEVTLWRGVEDVLLAREQKLYLSGIQDALAGAEAARVALAAVVPRLEGPGVRLD